MTRRKETNLVEYKNGLALLKNHVLAKGPNYKVGTEVKQTNGSDRVDEFEKCFAFKNHNALVGSDPSELKKKTTKQKHDRY